MIPLSLSLIAAIVVGLGGRWLGKEGASRISCGSMLLSFLVSLYMFFDVAIYKNFKYYYLGNWFSIGKVNLNFGFMFDSVTVTMLIVVTFVSLMVHIYSVSYMSEDPHLPRFLSYLSLFTFFMLILVTADNLVQLFIGWEGVGLCSYLLISFWFTRLSATKAALKAMLINRFGDIGVLLAMMLIYQTFYTFDFPILSILIQDDLQLVVWVHKSHYNVIELICFFLLIGAIGKSAQIGLHIWLPDAMEGPTPVSALIHAATMVTAGIFLIIRCSILFEHAPKILATMSFIGALTALFAGTSALMQHDLKRIIAFSTCSQLGFMLVACGLSAYNIALFHLVNHAFFKALLFLAAGVIIHSLNGEQDIRNMSQLDSYLPITSILITIGGLALSALPGLSGYFSKDLILNISLNELVTNPFTLMLLISALICSAAYASIIDDALEEDDAQDDDDDLHRTRWFKLHEGPLLMLIPMALLCVASCFSGYLLKDAFVGLGSDFFNGAIWIHAQHIRIIITEWLFGPGSLLFGIALCFLEFDIPDTLIDFYNQKWYFDKVYLHIIGLFFFWMGYNVVKRIWSEIIYFIEHDILVTYCMYGSDLITKFQSGNISLYLRFFFIFFFIFFLFIDLF